MSADGLVRNNRKVDISQEESIPMEKKTLYREHSGYTLMPFPAGQGDKYYTECLHKLDPEVARLTGTAQVPPREAVVQYYDRAVSDPDRFDFLIVAPDGRFIGESVLNELDRDARRANFRIVIFDRSRFCQGLGSWAAAETVDFAFRELGLAALELDVFSFNPRAKHVYEKLGFQETGREALPDCGDNAQDIFMALSRGRWNALKNGDTL